MKYKVYNVLPEFGTNTYLVWDENSRQAMMIDPAAPDRILLEEIKNLKLDLKYIINTHRHGDHIAGNQLIKDSFPAPLCIHKDDAAKLTDVKLNLSEFWNADIVSPPADVLLEDGNMITLGSYEVIVIHTPGHTQGGICLLVEGLLFSGDSLFSKGIGRTDLPGGNYEMLVSSIKDKLFKLPDETIVLPGHGPETTIKKEKRENPFVGLDARL
ncbi:MAG: MBL fold metallo-hydrolase [Candidatus Cloacimonetes bacterium]|nr:MBL fold metallo-hydrolase [Candidatus Cloacimonadota bacterium]MBL7149653.1 MBL fold metallo-hydrolase [Candidatus Cloacimonadota bacterium]